MESCTNQNLLLNNAIQLMHSCIDLFVSHTIIVEKHNNLGIELTLTPSSRSPCVRIRSIRRQISNETIKA